MKHHMAAWVCCVLKVQSLLGSADESSVRDYVWLHRAVVIFLGWLGLAGRGDGMPTVPRSKPSRLSARAEKVM